MRRRRRRYIFKFNFLIFIIIFFIVVSVGYAYLATSLHIGGSVQGTRTESQYTIDPTSTPNMATTMTQTNHWIEGNEDRYQYHITLTNNGLTSLKNFKITITFKTNIDAASVSTYSYSIDKKNLIIYSNNYNLNSKASISLDFNVSVKSPRLEIVSIKLEGEANLMQVGLDKVNVIFTPTGSTGSYIYSYNVTVTNKTGYLLSYWELDITLPSGTTFSTGSNATFSTSNNLLIIKNLVSNGNLSNNASTTFSLKLSTNIVNFIPTDIKVIVR